MMNVLDIIVLLDILALYNRLRIWSYSTNCRLLAARVGVGNGICATWLVEDGDGNFLKRREGGGVARRT